MSTDRTAELSAQDNALKLATREAVEAAGGQVFVAGEVDRAQSRISDFCSERTNEFMPINLVRKVEALGSGRPGHPHITRALARAQSLRVGGQMPTHDNATLADWLCDLTGEHADVIRAIANGGVQPGAARPSIAGMSVNARRHLSRELDQVIDLFAALKAEIEVGGA